MQPGNPYGGGSVMRKRFELCCKRIIDFLLSLIGLILLTIPFVFIALAIKLDSKGPVFFRQERVGMNR
jgi:lipopolysaccharide/colanic/teichoic acid biosynthesis glycosyltransferase